VETYSQHIFNLFLDIPSAYLRTLNKTCDHFLTSVYNDNTEETETTGEDRASTDQNANLLDDKEEFKECKFNYFNYRLLC